MAVEMTEILRHLVPDEPDYRAAAASLGPGSLAGLEVLAREAEPLLASKATHLASMIASPRSRDILVAAAGRSEAVVRVAAAAALRNLPASGAESLADRDGSVLDGLLRDSDPGVRKFARRTADGLRLRERI